MSHLTPKSPFIIMAMIDWIEANGGRPHVHLPVDKVQPAALKNFSHDGKHIVLNLSRNACRNMMLSPEVFSMEMRLGGVPYAVAFNPNDIMSLTSPEIPEFIATYMEPMRDEMDNDLALIDQWMAESLADRPLRFAGGTGITRETLGDMSHRANTVLEGIFTTKEENKDAEVVRTGYVVLSGEYAVFQFALSVNGTMVDKSLLFYLNPEIGAFLPIEEGTGLVFIDHLLRACKSGSLGWATLGFFGMDLPTIAEALRENNYSLAETEKVAAPETAKSRPSLRVVK